MSRESKIITAEEFDTQKTISHYESFGWELLSINGTQITMSRETQNPVYTELVKHQSQYETLLARLRALPMPRAPKEHAPFSFKTWFISLICLVIPCIVYTVYKIVEHSNYKNEYEEYSKKLATYKAECITILNEMDAVALESRGIFFSKKD